MLGIRSFLCMVMAIGLFIMAFFEMYSIEFTILFWIWIGNTSLLLWDARKEE